MVNTTNHFSVCRDVSVKTRFLGTVLISSWKCNYQYLLGYQSILLGYPGNIHTCMASISSLCVSIIFFTLHVCINRSPGNWRFRSLQSKFLPQFSTYRHRTGFIVKRKQVRIEKYIGKPINLTVFFSLFKVFFVRKDIRAFQNIP